MTDDATTTQTRALFDRALDEFGRRVHATSDDGWRAPTPCTEWDVRALVNHLVVELLWVPDMVAGRTIAEVGDAYDGDQLGADPVGAWDAAATAARDTFAADGAMERVVHLSYGDSSAEDYCRQLAADLVVHSWDLARGAGLDERLDPELVDAVYAEAAPQADGLAASGMFAPRVDVADDADPQTRLLALFGRRA